MKWIQNLFSTLKTWVFKKKLLQFSGRFARDPQACFYCPEMCRFSCGVAESLKSDALTPRGKMSLLHLRERQYSIEQLTETKDNFLYFLDQCTGCGRCTEFCVHEVDVASNLRREKESLVRLNLLQENVVGKSKRVPLFDSIFSEDWNGEVYISEPGRKKNWLTKNRGMFTDLNEQKWFELSSLDKKFLRDWTRGFVTESEIDLVFLKLKKIKKVYVESPELAWFLAKAIKNENEKKIKSSGVTFEVVTFWQKFFSDFYLVAADHLDDDRVVFHESSHLSRNLPRIGYSIPMYERGNLPFHSGWNALPCGGEGFYPEIYPENAKKMGLNFINDLQKSGKKISTLVCQDLDCCSHLDRIQNSIKIVYWADVMLKGRFDA